MQASGGTISSGLAFRAASAHGTVSKLARSGAFNTKLDDDFQIMASDPTERAKIEAGMKETEARIERDMDPFVSARQMDTDEIVELGALRTYLSALVEMAYQNCGYRRVKNPRIWSLHDLRELVGGLR